MTWLDSDGEVQGTDTFGTSERNLVEGVQQIEAQTKKATLEESPLAFWTARALTGEVDEVLVCDPRENHLISRSIRKGDEPDAKALARLLRMGELKEVYQPANDRRALYKQACSHYMDLRDQQRSLKQKIKSRLKRWGHLHIPGAEVFSQSGREAYLAELSHDRIREQVGSLYNLLDKTHAEKKSARRQFLELGRRYPETQEFQKIPGIGPISAHTFDAYIQTPHRFATKQKLWRYCKLGVRKHSSGGTQVRREKLDPAGHGELKALSHRAVKEALGGEDENEVQASYRASLQRTGDETHARLNTQRKVLSTMWGLWKNGTAYNPDLFYNSTRSQPTDSSG
jgi:transposase